MLTRQDHRKLAALVEKAGYQNVLESLSHIADAEEGGDALGDQLEALLDMAAELDGQEYDDEEEDDASTG